MKHIKIIELGGTISAHGWNQFDFKNYQSGTYDATAFQKALPELESTATTTFEQAAAVSSTGITPSYWIRLRESIMNAFEEEEVDGIVLTHGTSTLEETAYFLHLTVPSEKPIVMTGAQRPFTAIGSDAMPNLFHAVKTAVSPASSGKGVLVVLNQTIHSAREVTKGDTYNLDAFHSGKWGPIGMIGPDHQPAFYREPTRKHTIQSELSNLKETTLPKIEIIYSYAGADGRLIRLIANEEETAGIIMAGTGAGLMTTEEQHALQKAVERGMTIVRSNRTGNGQVLDLPKYAGNSFLTADDLLPQKARILLMLALQQSQKMNELQTWFHTH